MGLHELEVILKIDGSQQYSWKTFWFSLVDEIREE